MKTKITTVLFLLIFLNFSAAQTPSAPVGGGEFVFNPSKTPCLTTEQRNSIKLELKTNVETLRLENTLAYQQTLNRGNHPLFTWPIKKASHVTYNNVWSISGYVDHNANFPNQLTDYNCGTTTYDTASGYNHQGVDIYTWPFTWKLMDDDSVEVIAAAAGQIIAKNDGEFDRSCSFNNNIWNAIYIQHSDGSVAWYGHMKNGSLSTKNVGDTVAQGEFLGIVGSSGNSTGPHLHFEVYTDNTYTQLVDPYSGTCNLMNTDSWWQDQKPYKNPGISAMLTHSAAPDIFPTCPTTETPNISNTFDASDTIYFAAYLKDQTANDIVSLEILRPDNSTLFSDWNLPVQTTASSWYYLWNLSGYFNVNGEWTWKATFGGETISHTFTITGALSLDEETLEDTTIHPNPFNDIVNINSTTKIKKASVVDMLGKTVQVINGNSTVGINELNLAKLATGMYFVTLTGDNNQKKTVKLIKK